MNRKERETLSWAENRLNQKAEELHNLIFMAYLKEATDEETEIMINDFFIPYEMSMKKSGMSQEHIDGVRNYILQKVINIGEVAGHA